MAGGSLGRRMLCTACGRTDSPDTLVAGSDLLELVLWGLLLVPGLLYCGWRHLHRRRVCSHCGGAALLRESRASRHRTLEGYPGEGLRSSGARGQLVYAARHIPWMATPSERFRRVIRGGAVVAAAGVAFGVVSLNAVRVAPDTQPASPFRAPPTKAEIEKKREARVESLRRRECERLCAEFHRVEARSHRQCMQSCEAKILEDPPVEESGEDCAELLDPLACEYVSGKRPFTQGKAAKGPIP